MQSFEIDGITNDQFFHYIRRCKNYGKNVAVIDHLFTDRKKNMNNFLSFKSVIIE